MVLRSIKTDLYIKNWSAMSNILVIGIVRGVYEYSSKPYFGYRTEAQR